MADVQQCKNMLPSIYKISAIWLVNEGQVYHIFGGDIFFEQCDLLSQLLPAGSLATIATLFNSFCDVTDESRS